MDEAERLATRYERKFFVTELDRAQVRSIVRRHPALFREAYPPRYINNLYLDTPWMGHYQDNLDGAPERMKVRVRWYHTLEARAERPVLEFKIKRGWVGWKESLPFPPLEVGPELSAAGLRTLVEGSDLPPLARERLAGLRPALVNRYRREYYATPDGRFRVTIDDELTYYAVHPLAGRLHARAADHGVVIVELKYDRAHERQAERVASRFPFRLTRSSKYVRGVERCGAQVS
jgi:SPX domain protein involved in polyphosphate accumulation